MMTKITKRGVKEHFDKQADTYDSFDEKSYLAAYLEEVVVDQYKKCRPKRVLDIGVGTGRYLKATKGKFQVGLDLSETIIKKAKDKGLKNLMVADAARIPLKSKSFDFVLLTEVFEHLSEADKKQIVQEVKRVSKKGSLIIVTTPNAYWGPMRDLIMKLGIFWKEGEGPHEYISPKKLYNHFKSLGKIRMWTFGIIPFKKADWINKFFSGRKFLNQLGIKTLLVCER